LPLRWQANTQASVRVQPGEIQKDDSHVWSKQHTGKTNGYDLNVFHTKLSYSTRACRETVFVVVPQCADSTVCAKPSSHRRTLVENCEVISVSTAVGNLIVYGIRF
jgi:hypothetical protein